MVSRGTVYSYSRIGTFETCPAQFAFRYVKRTPPPVPEGVELFLGSRFHETMEYLYTEVARGRVPSLDDLLAHYRDLCETKWREAQRKARQMGWTEPVRITKKNLDMRYYFQKGEAFLRAYDAKYRPFDQDETLGIEYKVLFDLDEEGHFKMQGYVDRISRDREGVVWIRDYKTGSRKHEPGAGEEDQLALYQVGLRQDPKFRDAERIRLAWHYVADRRDDLVTAEKGPEEIEELKRRYIGKIKKIETTQRFEPTPSPLCGWCEYLSLCPAGQEYQAQRDGRSLPEEVLDFAAPAPAVAGHPEPDPPPLGEPPRQMGLFG